MRGGILGTGEIPRISVFRSNKYIYVQAIDDVNRKTVAAYSSFSIKNKKAKMARLKKSEEAGVIGGQLAKQLIRKGIKKGVFDRGRYAYLGRVKALADALRDGGLII